MVLDMSMEDVMILMLMRVVLMLMYGRSGGRCTSLLCTWKM